MWWLAVMLMLSEALCFDWAPLPLGELTPDSLVVFHLHSPKTGGSSLCAYLRSLNMGRKVHLFCRGSSWGCGVHANLLQAQMCLSNKRFKKATKVLLVTVADPVTRTVSEYNHCLRAHPNTACFDKGTFDYAVNSSMDILEFANLTANRQVKFALGCGVGLDLLKKGPAIPCHNLEQQVRDLLNSPPAAIFFPRSFGNIESVLKFMLPFIRTKSVVSYPHIVPESSKSAALQLQLQDLSARTVKSISDINWADEQWYSHALSWYGALFNSSAIDLLNENTHT